MAETATIDAVVRVDRAERHDVNATGYVDAPSKVAARVVVVNLSRSGCLVKGLPGLSVGDPVSLSLRAVGVRPAVVARVTPDGFGCAFETLLRPSEVQAVVDAGSMQADTATGAVRALRDRIGTRDEPAQGMVGRLVDRLKGRRAPR